jgi:two-component system, NarL family, response regulator LiaR
MSTCKAARRSATLRSMGERSEDVKPGSAIRVVLVDDHTLLRHGLRQTLLEHGLDVVGEASNGQAGARLVLELKPDVVVMDLDMPQMNGIEATRAIIEREPGARILMLTISTDDDDVLDALAAGACGYLVKAAPPEETVRAIRAAHAGDSTLSPQVATRFVARLRDGRGVRAAPPPSSLTPRELEILRLIADGRENAEIAELLVISPSTAKNHVANVLEKLGAQNRVQAAVYAVRNGLV